MKKFLSSVSFLFKALLLVVLLVLGWAFVNVSNFIKGKKEVKTADGKTDWWNNYVDADAGPVPGGGPDPGCPHVAFFDGEKFKIENDFLLGSPTDFFRTYSMLSEPKNHSIINRYDLLKFNSTPKKYNGKLTLQLQENEAEESFVNSLKLIRVVHRNGSEVVVDSSFEKFHVFDKKYAREKIVTPREIIVNGHADSSGCFDDLEYLWVNPSMPDTRIKFKKNDNVRFTFNGLDPNKEATLLVKSSFRDWMMGESMAHSNFVSLASLVYTQQGIRIGLAVLAGLSVFLGHKGMSALAALPLFMGVQCKSILFSYEGRDGTFRQFAINKPRAWNFGMETITLPKEAIKIDGSLVIKTEFTKAHKLAFVGVLQNIQECSYKSEEVPIEEVAGSRLDQDTINLSNDSVQQIHMIPGDKVDVTFRDPKIEMDSNEKETFLMQSSGFYTALRPKYRKIAGNWQERISDEAKTHLDSLVSIRSHH